MTVMSLSMASSLLLFLATGLIVSGAPNQDYYDDQADYDGTYEYDDENVQDDIDGKSSEQNQISQVRPVIISEPEHLVVDNGMTISLSCLVDQLPGGVQIMWHKLDKGKTILAIGDRVIERQLSGRATVSVTSRGSTLTIGAAKTEDAGQYKCEVAVQNNPPELKHTVSIRAPPSVSSSTPNRVTVEKGQDVTLACKGAGSPQPAIKWTRVGQKMPDGSSSIESDSVTFTRVNRKHAGTYKCTASNGHGTGATKQMEVIVQYEPEVDVSEVFVHKRQGDEAELVCTVHGFPPAKVTWLGVSQADQDSGRIKIDHRGGRHSLTIKSVASGDFKDYTCAARNEIGENKVAVKLSGHAKPAKFTSEAAGSEDSKFLVEWSSYSFTPITEFRLETRVAPSGSWTPHEVAAPTEEDATYTYFGKKHLTGLQAATQYQARVSASNGEGWGEPGEAWNFATKGAEVLASTAGCESLGVSVLLLIPALALLTRNL